MIQTVEPRAEKEVFYPSSDGKPMAESGTHMRAIFWLYDMLCAFFEMRKDVYVAADMLLYYEKGNACACRAPDVMVAIGVPQEPERKSFFTWREGVVPAVVVEISSESTIAEDLGDKKDVYERIGVREYFLFDPEDVCLSPRFQGFRLEDGAFVPLEADSSGSLTSERLGVRFVPEGVMLRVVDAATGEGVLSSQELRALNASRTNRPNAS